MLLKRGFTLLELLVVIAIIGVLVTVVIASLNDSRRKARNENVVTQMFEYQKSLELYYTETGSYPGTTGNRRGRYCIGDGLVENEACMGDYSSSYVAAKSAPIEAIFRSHMSSLPRLSAGEGFSSPAYSGCSGQGLANTTCTPSDYSIWFLLEKANQNCGRAEAVDTTALGGGYTLCRLQGK